MPSKSLEVFGLGKQYVLGGRASAGVSLYERLGALLGLSGEDVSRRRGREKFWALRNVGFEVAQGEVLGIVGRNGAGKSTLLKILSRITPPTEGRALVNGTLASLLEVGTGFHPELTGRENIFLNGTILGMRRREIDRKFDEIVDFAEIERFLDTPVKRYSSGMYVRLAFAVAAHLDADVLLIDEVLAVGDLAFQRKCLGKMGRVASSGRTVLFVSHNLAAVRSLCGRVLLVEGGRVTFDGPMKEGLDLYEASAAIPGGDLRELGFAGPLADAIRFETFVLRQGGDEVAVVDPTVPVEIEVRGAAERDFPEMYLAISIFREGLQLFSCHDADEHEPLPAGRFVSRYRLPAELLRPGRYTLGFGALRKGTGEWAWSPEAGAFEVSARWGGALRERDGGVISIPYTGERIVG